MPVDSPGQVYLEGSTVKTECCEHCGHEYQYTLTRKVRGLDHGFTLRAAESRRKAMADAEKKLKEVLAKEVDPVPCPYCGHLSGPMLRQKKRNQRGRVAEILVLIFCGLVLFSAGMMMLATGFIREKPKMTLICLCVGVILFAGGISVLIGKKQGTF